MKHEIITKHRHVLLPRSGLIEWRTLAVIIACYATWFGAGMLYTTAWWISLPLLSLMIVLHSSLQHEAIHRHPTRYAAINEALVFLPLGPFVPYRRYRDLHLLHHRDSRLTDPYDDPESFYLADHDHHRLPRAVRLLLRWNNMLLGRIVIGPLLATAGFLIAEGGPATPAGAGAKREAWGLHAIGLIGVGSIIHFVFKMPALAYLGAAYLGLSLLAIRSFCEHQWAETPDARTVIVERSLLGFLFLNNNLHLVHHKIPGLPWYDLPAAYRARRGAWQRLNNGYVYRSYGAVLRAFCLRQKEPVAHPRPTAR